MVSASARIAETEELAEKVVREEVDRIIGGRTETETKEESEQEAKEKAEQEAKERTEGAARVRAERDAKRKAKKEAKELAAQEAKEGAVKEAREKANLEAKEKTEIGEKFWARLARLEGEEKQKGEKAIREEAERETKEKAEPEKRKSATVSNFPPSSTTRKTDRPSSTKAFPAPGSNHSPTLSVSYGSLVLLCTRNSDVVFWVRRCKRRGRESKVVCPQSLIPSIRKTWIDIYARVIATIEGWLYKRIQAYIGVGRACSL